MKKILKFTQIYPAVIVITSLIAWYRTLNFWFLKGFETSWLMGSTPHTFINLIKSHSFLYYLDWKIFGWNPWGWYLTSLVLHTVAALILFRFIEKLTKNRHLSFISSLIFVANTAYNDVLTWGSFNSYYPLLLIFMLLALTKFIDYKNRGNFGSLLLSLLFSFLAFLTRETGLVIVPIITLYDVVYTKDALSRKNIYKIGRRQFLFYLSVLAFFLIRSWYGGIPGDFADSNVRMRIKLIADGLYLVYLKSSLLTLGKLIPPQVIPYPILNSIRGILGVYFSQNFLSRYFFPFVGWTLIGLLGYALFRLRKSKFTRLLLFFAGWLTIFCLFVAIAVPYTEEFLARDYNFITMRYRYFAFVGASVLLATLVVVLHGFLQKRIAKRAAAKGMIVIVMGYLGIQIFLLHRIQTQVYTSTFEEPKRFYSQFTKEFPILPDDIVFYIYPHTSGLNDFLFEWSFVKDATYPNLSGKPYMVESQIGAVLKKAKEKKIDLTSVLFLDYNRERGIINRTKDANRILTNQRSFFLKPTNLGRNTYVAEIADGPFVETPYFVEINMSTNWAMFKQGKRPDSKRFRALVDYSIDRSNYLKTVKIKTASTLSQRPGEPFLHVLPDNLVDGNIGQRSSWIVDAVPAWIEIDIGEKRKVRVFAWGSQGGSGRTPSTYSYSVSLDGSNWKKVLEVSNNKDDSRLDILDEVVDARYIKMDLHTTQTGSFALLDEFEVITNEAEAVLGFYDNRDELLNDSRELFSFISSEADLDYIREKGLVTFWGKLGWRTSKDDSTENTKEMYFPFNIDTIPNEVIIKLPEGEIYSALGQMFDKRLTEIYVKFNEEMPLNINVFLISLLPTTPL